MRNLAEFFKDKKPVAEKLIAYGFQKNGDRFFFKQIICNGQFQLSVSLSPSSDTARLFDTATGEEYVLADVDFASGGFVGEVRAAYEAALNDIATRCFETDIFKNAQTKEVIRFIEKSYGDRLEFLWQPKSNAAVCRNRRNRKWYIAFMTVAGKKLGLDFDRTIEIIDLRFQKEEIEAVVDNRGVFPGFHMNKKSWITVRLDGEVETSKIFSLIENSYKLSLRK